MFNRLKLLRDLPLNRVRELGLFAKNHQREALHELTIRGTVELVHAIMSLLCGPLRREVDACVGDVEEGVAKKNLDFFRIPTVVVHGVVPYAAEDSYGFLNYQNRTRFPFAFLTAEIPADRLEGIERALALPGKTGVAALLGFAQSNFGIVTQMEFRLIHKPERRYLFWGSAADNRLEPLIDRLDVLGRQRIFDRSGVNVATARRFAVRGFARRIAPALARLAICRTGN